jgi:hypothetical protein
MMDDDLQNLSDITYVQEALYEALKALRKAMTDDDRAREMFAYQLGFARGRLAEVCDRVYPLQGGAL